jgi:flagellar motor switch protein FliN/FliY
MSSLDRIAHYADVPIDIDVELDRRVLTVRDLLDLEAGSVIKLDRSAGENIDVLAGGTLLAFGEIVIVEDTIGVRITDFNEED